MFNVVEKHKVIKLDNFTFVLGRENTTFYNLGILQKLIKNFCFNHNIYLAN